MGYAVAEAHRESPFDGNPISSSGSSSMGFSLLHLPDGILAFFDDMIMQR
jgi:hypothetical protein